MFRYSGLCARSSCADRSAAQRLPSGGRCAWREDREAMSVRSLTTTSIIVALVSIAEPTTGQTAAQIIDRYIAAIGGSEALASVLTMQYIRTVFSTTRQQQLNDSQIVRRIPNCFNSIGVLLRLLRTSGARRSIPRGKLSTAPPPD